MQTQSWKNPGILHTPVFGVGLFHLNILAKYSLKWGNSCPHVPIYNILISCENEVVCDQYICTSPSRSWLEETCSNLQRPTKFFCADFFWIFPLFPKFTEQINWTLGQTDPRWKSSVPFDLTKQNADIVSWREVMSISSNKGGQNVTLTAA